MNHHADQLDAFIAARAAGDHDLADAIAAMTPEELAEALGGADDDAG